MNERESNKIVIITPVSCAAFERRAGGQRMDLSGIIITFCDWLLSSARLLSF